MNLRKVKKVKYNHVDKKLQSFDPTISLHPMNDWHLRSQWKDGKQSGGAIQFVWLFGLVGAFVLILACINFMNLSTAQSERRAKEVGIRKSIGSNRAQLINQFLTESFLVVLLSFVLAIVLVVFAMPYFNYLADKTLEIPLMNVNFWGICISFIVFTALLAGSYPALYLSSFRPVAVLKGTFKAGKSTLIFRRTLVILQFTVSITLIIGTLMVKNQIDFAKDRLMGYEVDGTIMLWSNTPDYIGKFEMLRSELKSKQAIEEMAQSTSPMTGVFRTENNFSWEGKDPDFVLSFSTIHITPDYGKTVKWELTSGRDFSIDFATDSMAVILNETAVKKMDLQDPLNQHLVWGEQGGVKLRIIGVVKDVLMKSPFQETPAAMYVMRTGNMDCMTIRLNPNLSTHKSLAMIEEVFKEHMPAVPFDYSFTDVEHAGKFAREERIGMLSGIFAALAIFISSLGILGMASFVTEQRTKEIGIRKVLGASV